MDKEYFLNSGIQPPLQFEPTVHAWNTLTSAYELNCSPSNDQPSSYCPNWNKQADHYAQMESPLTSKVSSQVAPDSPNALALRELTRKLNSGEMPQAFPAAPSCYTTPLNSSAKLQVPNLRNSLPLNPATLPALSAADPGFAERAAKFSCFGSRSFNGRTSQFGQNNVELPITMGNGKLPRVSSNPLLNKQGGSPFANKNLGQPQMEMRPANDLVPGSDKMTSNKSPAATGANSNEESSVSDEVPSANELNSRKRKAVARGKAKEDASTQAVKANTGTEPDADTNAKRSKLTEANVSENCGVQTEDGGKGSDDKKVNQKPPEPPKDYIHVRARRGQATDSHSLAERVRREKISERMKLLQDLVPGCNKVTGKALMLDEIINYVQSLQRQVEFLSMKLASVNPRLDSMDNLLPKDVYQPNASLPQPLFSMDSSEPAIYKKQPKQGPQPHNNGSVDHVDILCRDLGLHLPPLDGFTDGIPQFPPFCEDDLQSIVQMGYNQNFDREVAPFYSQTFPVASQASHMKIEL